ncbi:hypothetical protein [Novosphingobium sp. FSW06-99]|uniref:hypothetical protein n=1 Tax=Novosphingobium sp. FSW06-99 TaxID=1739113 RepID=UPI00076D41FD|nr:hypothetical protein [Novosphingobium sp. FSW06-99]KUR80747.1 hypothetical protein AQZ49_01590 [Novosphingobium sp. FSW06-99]
MATCTFNVGATILIGIECFGAINDDLIGATCVATLKAAVETVDGWAVPPAANAAVATFTPVARAASAEVGPGWNLSIDSETSAALPLGTYVTNAVITLANGLVVKTAALFITLTQATA